jgi:saccharopine dehydrogenase-like NADP-dependent oxidoreductase
VGCGFAPGVANVLTRYACDQMDKVERIMIRVARSYGNGEQEVVSAWKPTWSPEILLEDYAEPPVVFQDGEFVEVPIFSNPESYCFPVPIGEVLISSHSHEETYIIPGFYKDKGLKELDFKYPVDKLVGAFIKMGFASDEAVDVKGVQVVPRDVLMTLVERPGNMFFMEDEQTILQSDLTGIMDVTVDGEKDDERLTHQLSYRFTDGSNKQRQKKLYAAYGTTLVYVALPAMAGARMCAAGEVEAGVVSPDSLNPEAFFAGMAARGVPFHFDEQITKRTVIGD